MKDSEIKNSHEINKILTDRKIKSMQNRIFQFKIFEV